MSFIAPLPTDSVTIELPWPPSSLSGHNKGKWRGKSGTVHKYRSDACKAALASGITAPEKGDIRISITFYPPDRRGDRVNFPIRVKPQLDGIADAMKVNDSRFLPTYHFAEPVINARVVITVRS